MFLKKKKETQIRNACVAPLPSRTDLLWYEVPYQSVV